MNSANNPRIGIVGVCIDAPTYESLAQFALTIPGAVTMGSVDRYVGAEREAARALESSVNRVCVIDYDRNKDEAIWVTERLRSEFPDVFVFGISASSDPEKIIGAMRAGCAEYLVKPLDVNAFVEGVRRVEAKQKANRRSRGRRGKVIAVLGAKGGSGVTSVALHLAIRLAENKKRKVLFVDQHPALGDASLYLGTGRHQYSFFELASDTERLDQELLQGFLLHHNSGVDLLDSPEALDAVQYAPPAAIEQTLAFLADIYDYVVVDCPPGLTETALASVAQSDQLAIVLTAELPAVRNAVRYAEHLGKLGFPPNNVRIVLNRYSKKNGLPDEQIEKALQKAISFRIPNSYSEVIRAINSGVPIAMNGRTDFASAIDDWAADLIGSEKNKASSAPAVGKAGGVLKLFNR